MRRILIGIVIVGVAFAGALFVMERMGPPAGGKRPVATAPLPPLPAPSAVSQVLAPVSIALGAIQTAIEASAPRTFNGRRDNPFADAIGKAEVLWSVQRGPMAATGRADGLALSTPLSGSLRLSGQAPGQAGGGAGQLGRQLSGLLGGDLGRQVENLAGRLLEQKAEIRGNVSVLAKPALRPDWRIEPNLTAQVALADGGINIAGLRLNIAGEVRPVLDRAVNEQVAALEARLRADTTLEQTARREWGKLCRSVPLGAPMPGAPPLWLELKPVQAVAAQPRVTAEAAIVTLGVQAETRISTAKTKPACPFPAKLDVVPAIDPGRIAIAVPIDLPFADLSRLLDAQLKNRTFPEGDAGAAQVTVKKAVLAPAGERLLISLDVEARERRSWFGLGGAATVHIWGKPVLDAAAQVLRLDDVVLDVESEAAFGLLGAAARAAVPYLETEIRERTTLDLKPFAAQARSSIQALLADMQMQGDGVRAEAAITALRLTGIAYDQSKLRVSAEADGIARVMVTKLPGL